MGIKWLSAFVLFTFLSGCTKSKANSEFRPEEICYKGISYLVLTAGTGISMTVKYDIDGQVEKCFQK